MEGDAIFFGEKIFGYIYFASVFIAVYFAKQWMAKKEAEIEELFRRVNRCVDKTESKDMEQRILKELYDVEKVAGRHTHDESGRVVQTGW